jgi:RNA polymerase sigma-70 factor (ECF subfamily)
MDPQEIELVEALQHGNRAACADLVDRYASRIYGVALRLTGHPNEAEEVLQETLIAACDAVEGFQARSSLGTWLYRIATNQGLMRLRKHVPSTLSFDELEEQGLEGRPPGPTADWDMGPETDVMSDELRHELEGALRRLPEPLRAAFVLRDIEGLSTQEAAEALDITPGALKVRLHRARLGLRQALNDYFAEVA